MRYVEQRLPWTGRTRWAWPEGDRKLIGVFHQVADVDVIMRHVPEGRRSVCVQAGGACGVWALRFSQFFETVYTFEPLADNFRCLMENLAGQDRILAAHCALSSHAARVRVQNDVCEADNWGAGYIVPDESGVPAITLDSLELPALDLLQLDVEGAELQAVMGALKTIERYSPTICLEIKPLPHLPTGYEMPVELLEGIGYRVAERVHRDVILVR